jgi:hypothetical protein
VALQVGVVVPPLQEPAEVLTAEFLAVAVAERFRRRVAVADQRQVAQAEQSSDALADGVAEV